MGCVVSPPFPKLLKEAERRQVPLFRYCSAVKVRIVDWKHLFSLWHGFKRWEDKALLFSIGNFLAWFLCFVPLYRCHSMLPRRHRMKGSKWPTLFPMLWMRTRKKKLKKILPSSPQEKRFSAHPFHLLEYMEGLVYCTSGSSESSNLPLHIIGKSVGHFDPFIRCLILFTPFSVGSLIVPSLAVDAWFSGTKKYQENGWSSSSSPKTEIVLGPGRVRG